MSVITPPALTDIPDFPAPADRSAGAYNAKALAFGNHMANTFNGEVSALAQNVHHNANEAAVASAIALPMANYKGPWSTLTGALAVPASVSHGDYMYMLLENLANVALEVPGASLKWAQVSYEQRLELLSTVNASTAAVVEYALTVYAADYSAVRLLAEGVIASAGSNTLNGKLKQNDTWTAAQWGSTTTAISTATALGNASTKAIALDISVLGLSATTRACATFSVMEGELISGSPGRSGVAVLNVTPTTPVQGLQLYATTGTLTGTFRLYGVRK